MVGSQCVLMLEGCQDTGSFKVALPRRTWGTRPQQWPSRPPAQTHPGGPTSLQGSVLPTPHSLASWVCRAWWGGGSQRRGLGQRPPSATSDNKMQAWPSSPGGARTALEGLQGPAQRPWVCPQGESYPLTGSYAPHVRAPHRAPSLPPFTCRLAGHLSSSLSTPQSGETSQQRMEQPRC